MSGTQRGAHSLGDGGGGRRRRGLLPLILGLLAALILAAILIATCGGDDDDDTAATTTPPAQTTPADGATNPSATGGAGTTTGEDSGIDATDGTGGATAGGDGGQLVAGGQDLLPARQAQFGEELVGQSAQGTQVRVQEVVRNEGFFVGTGANDRVYVEFGGEVGQNEQGAQVTNDLRVGDVVDLEGEVRPAPEDAGRTLNLNAEQAQTVSEQGVFVNATDVTPQGG